MFYLLLSEVDYRIVIIFMVFFFLIILIVIVVGVFVVGFFIFILFILNFENISNNIDICLLFKF